MMEIDIKKTLAAATGEMLLQVKTQIPPGQFLTLYGKSGAGKTTLLRILAGLTEVDHGYISIDGLPWLDTMKKINLPPQERKIGFVFQDYALFPNMTVQQNLRFALAKKQSPAIINELIELIELGELQHRKPETLSGGQKQRVALARALVQQPRLLLLDEPLSALDAAMRNKLQTYLLKVHAAYNLTTILVSHNEEEIRKMSNEVIILEEGKVIKKGKVSTLFPSTQATLTGKILSITEQGEVYSIVVGIGENELVFVVERSAGKAMKVGDRIRVDGELKMMGE